MYLQIAFSCVFCRCEFSKVISLSIVSNIRIVSITASELSDLNAYQKIVVFFFVPYIFACGHGSEICNTIIGLVSIDMIDDVWLFVINHLPYDSMQFVCFAFNFCSHITLNIGITNKRVFSHCVTYSNLVVQVSSKRVISVSLKQFFL